MLRAAFSVAVVILLAGGVAGAQETPTDGETMVPGPAGPEAATVEQAAPGFFQGGGLHLGDDLIFHPSFELATGYQSNVFYLAHMEPPNDQSERGAPLMRFGVGGTLVNAPPGGPGGDPLPKLLIKGDINLTWNQFLTGDPYISRQSDLGIGLVAGAQFNPQGTFGINLRDGFVRSIQPPPAPSQADLNRDKNELSVAGELRPGEGALQFSLAYIFTIDFFERTAIDFANRMSHQVAFAGRWQWLPRTMFLLEASLGFVEPSSTVAKDASMPLRVVAGASTLITPFLGIVARAGYGNGFYDSGPSFSSYLALVEVRYAIGPTMRVAIGYSHDFTDSVVANFYSDHAFYGRFAMQLFGRLQIHAGGELRLRAYEGLRDFMGIELCGDPACNKTRSDLVARLDTGVEYPLQRWLLLGVAFSLISDTTDFFVRDRSGATDSGAFIWTETMARVAAKF